MNPAKAISMFFLALSATQAFANVNYIDFSKASSDKKLISSFNFVKDNNQYYDHWEPEPEWKHDKPKQEVINQLRDIHKEFSAIAKKNAETYLLLGSIAHYLYNMHDTIYNSLAVNNFNEAIKSNPKDYRAYWFLAQHYALSTHSILAIENFKKAEKLLPSKQPADFWKDYTWAATVASMPSHSIYAMDKAKSISGEKIVFSQQLDEVFYKRIIPANKNQSYEMKNIWAIDEEEDKIILTSKPLGIKIQLDSAWDLSIYDYKNNSAALLITFPPIANKKGHGITCNIVTVMTTADDSDKLEVYTKRFASDSDYPNKKKIPFSNKYEKIIAYEIIDKTKYQNIGGGHMYVIGIERNEPKYPGLLLEMPKNLPARENSSEIAYYTPSSNMSRFKGKMFYLTMLDCCEDIHEQVFPIFKSFFDKIIIE